MGRDKLLLDVCGVPLLRRVYDALAAPCPDLVAVGKKREISLEGLRWISDERPGAQGPLAGLEAGLAAARNRLVFVAAGDMPFVPQSLVGYLLGRLETADVCAVVPRYRSDTHPLCAAYDRETLPRVEAALDDGVRAVRALLERLPRVEYLADGALERFGDPGLYLMNVNSPEDLEQARARCGGSS